MIVKPQYFLSNVNDNLMTIFSEDETILHVLSVTKGSLSLYLISVGKVETFLKDVVEAPFKEVYNLLNTENYCTISEEERGALSAILLGVLSSGKLQDWALLSKSIEMRVCYFIHPAICVMKLNDEDVIEVVLAEEAELTYKRFLDREEAKECALSNIKDIHTIKAMSEFFLLL